MAAEYAQDEMVMGKNLMSASYGLRHMTNMSASRNTARRDARSQRRGGQCSCCPATDGGVSLVYEDLNSEILSAEDVVRVKSALDSGACRNCLGPDDLPAGVEPSGNPSGANFVGANNSPIKRYGEATTNCRHARGSFGTTWQIAAVSRPLNSVSQTCGPIEHPTGYQDVVFTNKTSYVLPPGAVAEIIKKYKPIAEFPREGNLYLAELELSSFAGQGPAR
jgi:hypothetical protein